MRRLCFFSLILFIALPSTASTVEAPEEVAPPPQPTPPPPLTSRTRREKRVGIFSETIRLWTYIKTLCYFPRLAIAKIQLGMLF